MANQNNKPRKVSRQNWKPGFLFSVASGLWTLIYSVFKVVIGALVTVAVIGGVCLVVFIGALGDYLQNDILPNSEVTLEGFDLVTTFTALAACINNIGPGLEMVGPMGNFSAFSPASKLLLSFNMLVGRLEIFPMLLLFAPSVWVRSAGTKTK